MILLNEESRRPFSHLKNEPTHVYCHHHHATYLPEMEYVSVQAAYSYGTVEDGSFVLNRNTSSITFDIPSVVDYATVPKETQEAALNALFADGFVPHEDDFKTGVALPGRKIRDFTERDIDVVFSQLFPSIIGGKVI